MLFSNVRDAWSVRLLGLITVALLFAAAAPVDLRADTTLDSGTTTVTTGTDFGTNLYVGFSGTATLEVLAGGSATNVFGYLGYNAGSVGTATVSSGTWFSGTVLTVGSSGTGTLNVTGGFVSDANCGIGINASGVGTATVSSGTWVNFGGLIVGSSGTGTLNVTGGKVTSGRGYVATAGGHGTATLSSGTWAISDALYIGYIGTGTLSVIGGSVTSTTGWLGYFPGGVGTATVSSGTWANSGNLTVGVSGTGTLTITGGFVTVGGTLSTGPNGTIAIGNGGTTGVLLGGTGSLTNNGTLIFNRSDAHTYSGVLSGSGAVTKQGAGQLTFDGANSYSGLTTISGGTISLSGTGSIGTGGLSLGTGGVFDITALASSTYSLPATGNLTGAGTLVGTSHTLAVFGSFLPGSSAGTVTVGSGLTLDLTNSGSSAFQITNPSYTAGTFDLVNGDGSVLFGGVLNLDFSGGAYANGVDVLRLFTNTGGLSGGFSAVNFSGLGAGQSATFNPATGFISLVPEPSTLVPLAAGLVFGCWQVTRRRSKA